MELLPGTLSVSCSGHAGCVHEEGGVGLVLVQALLLGRQIFNYTPTQCASFMLPRPDLCTVRLSTTAIASHLGELYQMQHLSCGSQLWSFLLRAISWEVPLAS